MQQIDKGDKPLLTFFLSISDDKKIIQIINHSMKTMASHHGNNSIRDTVENERCARETKTKSVVHIIIILGKVVCAKHPVKALYFSVRGENWDPVPSRFDINYCAVASWPDG